MSICCNRATARTNRTFAPLLSAVRSAKWLHMAREQKTEPNPRTSRKEWRPLELRKLPIEATANATAKGGVNSCDGNPGCPKADASGQFS
jgi:hypothetical protein